MLILIDNYDSFTYNLYQLIALYYPDVKVIRNDEISIKELVKLEPRAIIISPGPGQPSEAGISIELIRQLGSKIPILGVCLGMQAIAEAFGGKVLSAGECMHGKSSFIFHRRKGIFKSMKLPFEAARYHSLVVDKASLPKELVVEAESSDELVMALRHVDYPIWGVQFHPESILTESGGLLIKSFLKEVSQLAITSHYL